MKHRWHSEVAADEGATFPAIAQTHIVSRTKVPDEILDPLKSGYP